VERRTPWGLAAKSGALGHVCIVAGGEARVVLRSDAPDDALEQRGGWMLSQAEVKGRRAEIYSQARLTPQEFSAAITALADAPQ
jgi:hypothetical protein